MNTDSTCASTCSTSPTSGWPGSASPPVYGSENPFAFMELQDVQELTNFFERRVSAYQVGGRGHGRLRRRLLSLRQTPDGPGPAGPGPSW